jgi:uncharacterized protein (DUF885 family)
VGPVRRPLDDAEGSLVTYPGSPLEAFDMVFVDPVGTGYSRLFHEGAGSAYWGIEPDADAVLAFIGDWLAREGRQASPLFVMGESYGGVRAIALLARAESFRFTGALLLSPAVDMTAGTAIVGNNLPYVFRLPSMAATAVYHGVVAAGDRSLAAVFEDGAAFAQSDYAAALYRGSALPADDKQALADRLAALAGLPASYWSEQNLRVGARDYLDQLLAAEGLRVGFLDARRKGPLADYRDQRPPLDDPGFGSGGGGRSTGALLDEYFSEVLGTTIERPYRTLNLDANQQWDFGHKTGRPMYFSVAPQLEEAMQEDPRLRVFVGGGIFDLATPVMAARYIMSQLDVAPERFMFRGYEAGHTAFDHEPSREALTDDMRAFISETEQASGAGWTGTAADRALERFFAAKWREDITRSPELKNSLGIAADQDRWTPESDARKAEDARLAQARLEELRALFDRDDLSEEGRLNYDLYRHELETALLRWEYQQNSYAFTRTPFDPYAGWPQYLVSQHRVDDLRGAEDYIARLAGLPAMLDDLAAATEVRAGQGIVLPAFNFEDIATTSRQIASGRPCDKSATDNRLWADFKGKVDALHLAEAEEERLLGAAATTLSDTVCPAYRDFAKTFEAWGEDVERNDGIWATPDGDRWYRVAIRLFTTRELDPEAIHQTGLDEVERIEAGLRGIMAADDFEGTLNDYFAQLSAQPGMLLPQTDAGREAYLAQARRLIDEMRGRLPDYFAVLPQAEVVALAVEKEREAYQSGAFYVPAPLDGTRPGTFYVNLSRLAEQPLWQLETLAYHEAIPGHHLQIALARESEDLPEFRRQFSNSAFQEGWALYAEALAKEMGAYPPGDPGDVGRLHAELRRAVRLVVDTGLHHQRWSMEEAAQYITAHLQTAPDSAMREMERYANWPGQALNYKLGQLEIETLRARAQARLGAAFDLAEFHTVLLNRGVLPFDLLEQQVDAWTAGVEARAATAPAADAGAAAR